ncbi:MAG: hypothetical protein JNK85_22910 [Verrucomicrobiales bacterium]|nr:hypothetical protein [Verrucomicrobiales bacterium]
MDSSSSFPPFSLFRLLKTTFEPRPGERIAVLIDLPNPQDIKDFSFLADPSLSIQRLAHDVFYRGLQQGVAAELGIVGGDLFAYRITGGSNLDLPPDAFTPDGRQVQLAEAVYPRFQIILCISTFSATAPLTAFAKQFGFRGATLHGLNDAILRTGLAVDYNEVSRNAEKLRLSLTRADGFEVDFEVHGRKVTLRLDTRQQEAQKSHGLCRGEKPDVANLPAGEVYFVPAGASGAFPMRYADGTLGLMHVQDCRIQRAEFLAGDPSVVATHNAKLASDPVTGELGELGFGTQSLPPSGRDIQDEKILGTMHVATGRSDHLGGHLTPEKFASALNATHDDILFAPHKTPEIFVHEVRMIRDNSRIAVLRDYQPTDYLKSALAS